jgi:hypothetical protein
VKRAFGVNMTPVDLAWATKLAGGYRADFVCQINFIFLSEICSPSVALFPFVILGEQVRLIFYCLVIHVVTSFVQGIAKSSLLPNNGNQNHNAHRHNPANFRRAIYPDAL